MMTITKFETSNWHPLTVLSAWLAALAHLAGKEFVEASWGGECLSPIRAMM